MAPFTNSHDFAATIGDTLSLAIGGAHHVAALPPHAQAATLAASVAGTVAARRRSRVTPVDDARLVARASERAALVPGWSASDQRRLEMTTESMRGW